jgi:hypothetical protein
METCIICATYVRVLEERKHLCIRFMSAVVTVMLYCTTSNLYSSHSCLLPNCKSTEVEIKFLSYFF